VLGTPSESSVPVTLQDRVAGTIAAVQHHDEQQACAKLEAWFFGEPAFREYFEEVEEEGCLPDLYGKSLLVTEDQFPDINSKLVAISAFLGIQPPECFVYEGYRYLCDSEGLGQPRLELSARVVRDFSDLELTHLLAKELYHIAADHLRREMMAEKMLTLVQTLPSVGSGIPGVGLVMKFGGGAAFEAATFSLRNIAFNWYKTACFSADSFACAYTGDLTSSLNALLLTIFNERSLVAELNVREYLKQIGKIEGLMGPLATLDKVDEVLPYGPYRVLNLFRYTLSARGRAFAVRCAAERG